MRRMGWRVLSLLAALLMVGATATGCGSHTTAHQSGSTVVASPRLISGFTVWALGTTSVWQSTDGGVTWTARAEQGSMLGGLAFCGDHGWTAADEVAATTDAGRTWTRQSLPGPARAQLGDVAFADAYTGWVVGTSGGGAAIYHTSDGGSSWTAQRAGVAGNLVAVACADASHAWAVGGNRILATADGGATWSSSLHDVDSISLRDVACADARHVWVVGYSDTAKAGVILTSGDGGRTWRTYPGPFGYLRSVAFADALHGWAVGATNIVATTDGGRTWAVQSCPLPRSFGSGLFGVAAGDAQHVWAVGKYGVVLASSDGGRHWNAQSYVPHEQRGVLWGVAIVGPQ